MVVAINSGTAHSLRCGKRQNRLLPGALSLLNNSLGMNFFVLRGEEMGGGAHGRIAGEDGGVVSGVWGGVAALSGEAGWQGRGRCVGSGEVCASAAEAA